MGCHRIQHVTGCLYEIVIEQLKGAFESTARSLLGLDTALEFTLSPDRQTAVVVADKFYWLDLPSGKVRSTHRVDDDATAIPSLSNQGVLWVPRTSPLPPLVVNWKDPREAPVEASKGFLVGAKGEVHGLSMLGPATPRAAEAIWLDASTVLTLRVAPFAPYALVTVDVGRLLGREREAAIR